jgi:hypothetical protein
LNVENLRPSIRRMPLHMGDRERGSLSNDLPNARPQLERPVGDLEILDGRPMSAAPRPKSNRLAPLLRESSAQLDRYSAQDLVVITDFLRQARVAVDRAVARVMGGSVRVKLKSEL